MKKTPCQYAIVRFAPFVETGEFANVGVIMVAPRERYFDFKLLYRRYARVTHFFEELETKVFRSTMWTLSEELNRAREVLKAHGFDKRFKVNDIEFANKLFAEIIRPRETIVRFGEPRVVLTDNPKATLQELFGFYVERNFVTKEYRETALEKGVRKWLYDAQIGDRFVRAKIGDNEYQATFPFVQQIDNEPTKIIKPLHLAHDDSSKILEHGGNWWFRIRELKKRNTLPEKVLFAIERAEDRGPRGKACREVVDMLADIGVDVVPYRNKDRIVRFARNA